jgi:hypothetical protein
MNRKSIGLVLGALGTATAQAVVFTDTAQGQITSCDNPNYCYCTWMEVQCGWNADETPMMCPVYECYYVCC